MCERIHRDATVIKEESSGPRIRRHHSFGEKVDWYFRREDTAVARLIKKIAPQEGLDWTNSKRKRVFETCVTAPLAVASIPVISGFAVAIKLDDGGSVFYKQKRLGKDGCVNVIKIRSMKENSDIDRDVVVSTAGNHVPWEDPRVTRVGRVLRKYDIDETPQLWQVMSGQLSLCGPRAIEPESLDEIKRAKPNSYEGWKQGYNPAILSLQKAVAPSAEKYDMNRVHYDSLYARKASLGLDLYKIYKTTEYMLKKLF